MSVKFYFVRHGQSTVNLRSDFYEDERAELTELGKVQAAKAGYELRDLGVKFRAIFCSPYKRALDTCKIALERAEMREALATVDNRISERKYGRLIGTVLDDGKIDDFYNYNLDCSVQYGAESLEALEERARMFIDEVVRNYQYGNILVFSHGDFGLAFRAVIEGRPESGDLYDWNCLKNGEMMVLEA